MKSKKEEIKNKIRLREMDIWKRSQDPFAQQAFRYLKRICERLGVPHDFDDVIR